MFREKLEENEGMLFIFPPPARKISFWMKNTLIPLDIIFIDQEKKISEVIPAYPCKKDPCPLFTSHKTVQYVLEVNQGFSQKHSLQKNLEVKF